MKDYFWSIINTFLSKGFGTIFSVIIGNLILPEDLGVYVAILLVVNYCVSLFSLSIETGIIQKLNDDNLNSYKNHYFSSALLFINLLGGGILVLIYVFQENVAQLFNLTSNIELMIFASPIILLSMNRRFFNAILQADLRIKEQTIINVTATVLQIVSVFIFLKLGYSLSGIFFSLYIAQIFSVVAMAFIALGYYKLIYDRYFKTASKDLLKFSILIYIGFVAVLLDKNIDLFFVNFFLNKEDVAVYNYAIKIALLILLFGNSISNVTYPILSKLFSKEDKSGINKLYGLSLNFSFVFISLGSLFLINHFSLIIQLVLPPYYLIMEEALVILIIGLVFFTTRSSVGTMFTARGIPAYSAYLNWTALAINAILCYFFIPQMGIFGAALSTAISFTVRAFIGILLIEYKIGTDYNYFRIISWYIVFSGLAILKVYVLENYLVIEMLFIIYLVGCYFVVLRKSDRKVLSNVYARITKKG